ncbi:MAG: SIR2 family protein [Myxococcales bacterium]|nr:SIR2 family protein [Myxococcales bacterium]
MSSGAPTGGAPTQDCRLNAARLTGLGFTESEIARLVDFVASWSSHNGPLLFVGSGLSRFEAARNPGVPESVKILDWGQLTRRLSAAAGGHHSNVDGTPTEALGIAQTYEAQAGRGRLIDQIEAAVPYDKFSPGTAHRALCDIGWASVITTNYDDLLERAFQDAGRSVCKIVSDIDLSRAREPGALQVIKMHGCLLASRESIVLSTDDYAEYEGRRPGIASKVKSLLCEHPVLFLGFSLTDPNVTKKLEWVQRSIGKYELASVALVHESPSRAVLDYWAARSVHLVVLPARKRVAEFLEALRLASTPQPESPERSSHAAALAKLREVLESRAEGWADSAAARITEAVETGHLREQIDVAHHVLHGAWYGLSAEEIRGVLSRLEEKARDALLLVARRAGIVLAGARGELDIEQELLGSRALTPEQHREVLVLRGERLERSGDVDGARAAAASALRLCSAATWSADVDGRFRRLVFRIGDEGLVKNALAAPLAFADAFGCARRGADLLSIEGRAPALPWFERAHKLARSADEKTAAILGIQACSEPGEWKGCSDIDPFWPAIHTAERPRVDAIRALEVKAGDELLRAFREGAKAHGNEVSNAVEHLEEALTAADDMGWSRRPSPNFTGPADSIGYSAFGLLMREDAPLDEVQRGLKLFVQRGLRRLYQRVRPVVIDKLLSLEAVEPTAEFLRVRNEAAYMSRSRDLLTSALLPSLGDAAIEAHVARVLKVEQLRNRTLTETSSTELHLELLERHFHVLPRKAALHVAALIAQIFEDDDLEFHRYAAWTCLPVYDWTKSGTVEAASDEVQRLAKSVVAFLGRTHNAGHLERTRAFRLVDELRSARAVGTRLRKQLVAGLDREIASGLGSGKPTSEVLAAYRARHELAPCEPPQSLRDKFPDMYENVRNSTVAGTWMNLVDLVGAHLAPEGKAKTAVGIRDYLDLTLRADNAPLLGPFPDWAATAIHQGVKGGVLAPGEGWEMLERLSRAHPESIVFALGMPGADLDAGRRLLLEALSRDRISSGALLQWCVWVPKGTAPNAELEQVLCGRVFSGDPETRQRAYWSLGWLSRRGALSNTGKRDLARFVLSYGSTDPQWKPRAAAIVAAAELRKDLPDEEVTRLLRSADADPVAGVRRAGGFLRRVRERGVSKRRHGRL